jgi:hypothetical protein
MQSSLRHFVAVGDQTQAQAAAVIIEQLQTEIERLNLTIEQLTRKRQPSTTQDQGPQSMTSLGNSTDFLKARHEEQMQNERDLLALKMENHTKERAAEQKTLEQKQYVQEVAQQYLSEAGLQAIESAQNLIAAYQKHDFDKQMKELDAWRDAELAKENLTAKEKQKIDEEYQKKRAALQLDAWKKQRNADMLSSIISGALAVTRAMAAFPGFPLNAGFVIAAGAQAAIQTAAIAAQPVPQFATGRYATVQGATDGLLYNAELSGAPRTGIYSRPALIAEKGSELIIDAATTKNIQLNYPDIMAGIYAARVPQYATGRLPDRSATTANPAAGNSAKILGELKDEMRELSRAVLISSQNMQRNNDKLLSELKAGGIPAKLSLFDLDKMSDNRNRIENETGF